MDETITAPTRLESAMREAMVSQLETLRGEFLDEIKVDYLAALDDGNPPTITSLIERYPEFKDELVEFCVTAVELKTVTESAPVAAGEQG